MIRTQQPEHFAYVYGPSRYAKDNDPDDTLTWAGVLETALCFFAMCITLVLVMIGWLCG
jgi:hypothetical protein